MAVGEKVFEKLFDFIKESNGEHNYLIAVAVFLPLIVVQWFFVFFFLVHDFFITNPIWLTWLLSLLLSVWWSLSIVASVAFHMRKHSEISNNFVFVHGLFQAMYGHAGLSIALFCFNVYFMHGKLPAQDVFILFGSLCFILLLAGISFPAAEGKGNPK